MEDLIERQTKARKLVDRLVELNPDQGTTAYALKMREHLKLPMSVVLQKLNEIWPEESVTDIVKRLGITRQAYYGWMNGIYRPDAKLSKKLASLTGFGEDDIRGRLPPRRP